jgi:hypothetical protein
VKCESPVCSDELKLGKHGGDPQKYCNRECRMDAYAIRRAAKLLEGKSDQEKLNVLKRIDSRGT